MRVLFDENVPRGLRKFLNHHEVRTAQEEKLTATKNGELLRVAEERGFELLLSVDKNLEYQQNLKDRKIGLAILPTNDLKRLREILPRIVAMVDSATPNSYQAIDLTALGPPPVRRSRGPQT